MKTLVVDDSTTMRRIISSCLASLQLTDVVHASDGVEAVAAIKAEPVGLVLMDWNMPNMTGIEALRAIRALGMTMPVIMVTTEAEKERVLEALKSGANNYIIKPFRTEQVAEKVKETLARAGIALPAVVQGAAA